MREPWLDSKGFGGEILAWLEACRRLEELPCFEALPHVPLQGVTATCPPVSQIGATHDHCHRHSMCQGVQGLILTWMHCGVLDAIHQLTSMQAWTPHDITSILSYLLMPKQLGDRKWSQCVCKEHCLRMSPPFSLSHTIYLMIFWSKTFPDSLLHKLQVCDQPHFDTAVLYSRTGMRCVSLLQAKSCQQCRLRDFHLF